MKIPNTNSLGAVNILTYLLVSAMRLCIISEPLGRSIRHSLHELHNIVNSPTPDSRGRIAIDEQCLIRGSETWLHESTNLHKSSLTDLTLSMRRRTDAMKGRGAEPARSPAIHCCASCSYYLPHPMASHTTFGARHGANADYGGFAQVGAIRYVRIAHAARNHPRQGAAEGATGIRLGGVARLKSLLHLHG